MKKTISYSKLSQGLANLLSMKRSNHFNHPDLTFDQNDSRRYLYLFEKSQATIKELEHRQLVLGWQAMIS